MTRRTGIWSGASALKAAVLLAAALVAIGPVRADEVKRGEALAQRLCSNCHVVYREVGPTFIDIAKGPHASPAALSDFLRSTHADIRHPDAMPTPELSQREIDALAAYIASLRPAN